MHFQFIAKIKLLTLNQAFITLPNGRRCRSKEYTKFAQSVANKLMGRKMDLQAFNDSFNPKIHEIHARLVFWTPDLYTKAGMISKNSMDVGNVEKCLLDNVLTGDIDDSAITKLEIQKLYGADHSFNLELNIVERVQLKQ